MSCEMLLVNQTLRLLEQAAEMRPFRLGSRTAGGAKGHSVTKKIRKPSCIWTPNSATSADKLRGVGVRRQSRARMADSIALRLEAGCLASNPA